MTYELTVLGANSALPAYNRFPSAQVLNVHESLYLIDCGEGTQIKMSQYKIKRSKINRIFISHLHGDHILGLPGLLNSYSLNRRENPLHIYSPPGLKEIIDVIFEHTHAHTSFEIHFHELNPKQLETVVDCDQVQVYTFPLKHRIPTVGYLFIEKEQPYKVNSDKIKEYNLTVEQIKKVKKGESIELNGEKYEYDTFVYPQRKQRTYAYCSDTVYDPTIVNYIRDIDLLYHEATYLHEMKAQADDRMHTTCKEAGIIAKQANVGQLIIGHYSSRYKQLEPLLEESRAEFSNTLLAIEGHRYPVEMVP